MSLSGDRQREAEIREKLRELNRRFQDESRPLISELQEIEARKPKLTLPWLKEKPDESD